jgi:hypothetical protein
MTQRRIPKERNSRLNCRVTQRRIPKERNSGLNYRVTQRRIPKERNSRLNYRVTQRRIPKERNSRLNYTVTHCSIPKERNSGLNYTVTQQLPLHTENGGKKVLRNVSTYQSLPRHMTKDSNHNDPPRPDVTYRKARSFEALPSRPQRAN